MKQEQLGPVLTLSTYVEDAHLAEPLLMKFLEFEKSHFNERRFRGSSQENYFSNVPYSVVNLLRSGRFKTGQFNILTYKDDPLCASGCYAISNVMICGVRALVSVKKPPELFFCHFEYILKAQFELAKTQQLPLSIITFNIYNEKVCKALKRLSRNSPFPLREYSRLLTLNNCRQRVLYLKNFECDAEAIIDSLENLVV